MKLIVRLPAFPPAHPSPVLADVNIFRKLASRRLSILALALVALLLGAPAHPAQAKYAAMVVDAETGEVLHAANADSQNYPASLTKMMTLYLLFDALDSGKVHLTDEFTMSAHAAGQAPSKLGLRPGQTLAVEDAILALVTKSANDVAVMVGESLGGNEPAFAQIMTRKAAQLGMRQTQFRNASGLPNLAQHSTARDMATLARALIHNHANYYHYFSTREFTYNGQVMASHNHMMSHYPGADGIKTGYIAASGFNLVASAKRDGRRLIGVVFGGPSAVARDKHMMALLDAGFARAPGSSGVELAEMPEQPESADTAEAPAAPAHKAKPVVTARDDNDDEDTAAVVKDLKSKGKKLAQAARKPEPAGDADDEDDDDEDDWGIQIGAYAQKAKAREAVTEAMHKLGKLVSDGEISVAPSKNHMYRARVIGLPEDTARQACHRLAKAHTPCSVVNGGVTVAAR